MPVAKNIFRASRRGMTLIIVLITLTLLTIMVVAFLSSIGTEMRSSKRYADSLQAKLLSQSAVNLAIAQITQGTSGVDSNGNTLAWASQPGMIRTYDTSGNPSAYYKLYSWDANMTGAGAFDPTQTAEQVPGPTSPQPWSSQPAVFTDLNDPVKVDSTSYYPIVDPAALSGTSGSTVTGFSLSNAPVASGSNSNQVPMPVKWLYVLADGTLVPPTASSSANQVTVTGATATNPITGRIAFWTDDDTCKINVNTASEGTYWDTPRIVNSTEYNLGNDQPAQNEFQRYPGHPAMTSLSTVLPLTAEQIYSLIPRVVGGSGSSLEGTVSINGGLTGAPTLFPDTDRLFPSVDELLFTPSRQIFNSALSKSTLNTYQFFLTAHSRAPDLNLFNLPRVCMWPINASNDTAHRSAYDQLAAFCSTVNTFPFYFQRQTSTSSSIDLPATGSTSGLGRNRMLMEYLRYLLGQKIPGFGGDFRDKYSYSGGGGQEIDQILTEMFDYIRSTNLEDRQVTSPYTPQIPYQSGNAVYVAGGSGQVVPIVDSTTSTRGFGRMNMVQGAMLEFIGAGDSTTDASIPVGYVKVTAILYPLFFDPSAGYANDIFDFDVSMTGMDQFQWETWSNASHPATGTLPLLPSPVMVSMHMPFTQTTSGLPAQTTTVPPFDFTFGSSGYPIYGDREYGASMGFPEIAHNRVNAPNSYPYLTPMATAYVSQSKLDTAGLYTVIMPKNGTFNFTGATVTVNIYPPNVTTGTPVQQVDLVFPNGTFPVPKLAPASMGTPAPGSNFQNLLTTSFAAGAASPRLNPENGAVNSNQITQEDVVRSIVPATGDMRMMAARALIKATDGNYNSFYGPHINYSSPTLFDAHNLRTGSGSPFYGATGGRLVPVNYSNQYSSGNPIYTGDNDANGDTYSFTTDSSVVPSTVANGVRMASGLYGDWDTGVGSIEDGPYINKSDEGDYEVSSTYGVDSYFSYGGIQVPAPSLFSPNRMVPSAGVMGSLSSGVLQNHPWQTLLFCPNPAGGSAHPGFGLSSTGVGPDAWPPYTTPPDHLLMDLFSMPVVEPYAISEPFSTAGRINMNYQMVPFTYINRTTALQAILKSEKVIAIPNSVAPNYKSISFPPPATTPNIRLAIDPVQTLIGFDRRFNPQNYGLSEKPDIFRSPSEICDIYLVPQGQLYTGMSNFWASSAASTSYLLTGDNCRERPYATIYPRLTTKSNTFTVYVRVQALKQALPPNSPPSAWQSWREGTDVIAGEYRGYQTVERYVDPTAIPAGVDYASTTIYSNLAASNVLGRAYKFRVVEAKQFSP